MSVNIQITIYRIQDKPEGEVHELDQTILTALFKSQHLSPPEQLSLGKYYQLNKFLDTTFS